jgi:hypothetical protein
MERSRHPEHARLSLGASVLRLRGIPLSTDSRRPAELTPSGLDVVIVNIHLTADP